MDCINNYKDLSKQICIHLETIQVLETELYGLQKLLKNTAPQGYKGIDYSGMPHGSADYTSFDRIISRLQKVKEKLKIEKELYQELLDSQDRIKDYLSKLDGIHYKVAYMRDVEYKDLKTIAAELGKSEGYIKNISSETYKMLL